jgi:hypothetical protein
MVVFLVFRQTNAKSHPRPEKAPNGINAVAIDGLADVSLPNEISKIVSQTSVAA